MVYKPSYIICRGMSQNKIARPLGSKIIQTFRMENSWTVNQGSGPSAGGPGPPHRSRSERPALMTSFGVWHKESAAHESSLGPYVYFRLSSSKIFLQSDEDSCYIRVQFIEGHTKNPFTVCEQDIPKKYHNCPFLWQ